MYARYVRMQWENNAHTIATFYFAPESRYRFEAGQYAVLNVPHPNTDNRGTQRTMTISSSPDDELIAFTMKIYANGSSFKRALLSLKPEEEITVQESLGDLVLPLPATIPLVYIAGGVGVASFTGMVRWLTSHEDDLEIQLNYLVARP
jgi:ferredoxin-NADP reductase